ncbi:MAG: M28 family peptidase [Anaerolineae bacterium]|nr:M28 family metallopeptidase [Anaerolineae bacterium]MDW8101256.1 M28 family peptidase [Anaerolineae bacterium]
MEHGCGTDTPCNSSIERLLKHVRVLAAEIGPRGTGTEGESAAASYVARCLADMGLPVERMAFRAVADQNAFPMAVGLVTLVAVSIYPLGSLAMQWLAVVLSLSTPFMFWQVICHSDSLLRPLLPHVTSQNVISRIAPADSLRQRAVILAHLDTNRCRLAWSSAKVRFLEPLTWLTFFMLLSVGFLYLLGVLFGGAVWAWWLSLLPAGYIMGSIATLWWDWRAPFSPGAHDNASGVAVALEIAARFALQPLRWTEVWLVFTGAEETDHRGLKTFLRRYRPLMREAIFIDLEGVGSGELVYLTRQGLCWPYRPDPALLALVEQVAAVRPALKVRPAAMIIEDEVRILRNGGYRAICLAGYDPATSSLPYWHRADDTVDTVSGKVMAQAVEFVMEILNTLDSKCDAHLLGKEEP